MKYLVVICFSILSLTAYSQRDSSLIELSKKENFDSLFNKKIDKSSPVSIIEYETLRVEYKTLRIEYLKEIDLNAQLDMQYKEAVNLLEEMRVTNVKLDEFIEKKDSEIKKLKEELDKCKSKKKN